MKFPLFFILMSPSLAGHSETKQMPAPFEPVNLKDSSMSIQGMIKFPTKILKSKEDIINLMQFLRIACLPLFPQ
jgi:hypothetical protein